MVAIMPNIALRGTKRSILSSWLKREKVWPNRTYGARVIVVAKVDYRRIKHLGGAWRTRQNYFFEMPYIYKVLTYNRYHFKRRPNAPAGNFWNGSAIITDYSRVPKTWFVFFQTYPIDSHALESWQKTRHNLTGTFWRLESLGRKLAKLFSKYSCI